nr:unnamed protein product [Callosobruchus analis]
MKSFPCGTIDKACIRNEWQKWIRSLCLYLDSENINDPIRKRNKLLHLGGTQLQEIAYNIPGAVTDSAEGDAFSTLVDELTKYFSPVQNSVFERHTFRKLKPENEDSLNKYLLKLRQQATKCYFGTTREEALEINIKDKLIDDWAPLDLKRKLLEKERSLAEIIDICQVHEQIKDQTTAMNIQTSDRPTTSINKISLDKTPSRSTCSRCGSSKHQGNDLKCSARSAKCFRCERIGHFASLCRTKAQKRPYPERSKFTNNRKMKFASRVNYVDRSDELGNESDGGNTSQNYDCFKLNHRTAPNKKEQEQNELIECYVGGIPVKLLIDSGSKANIVNGADWEHLRSRQAILWNVDTNTTVSLKPYAVGQILQVQHQFQTTVMTPDKKEVITTFLVVEQGDVSLLGKETAQRLGILKIGLGVNTIRGIEPFPTVKNVKVKLSIESTVKPVQQPLRRVPIAIEPLVEEKLKEALERDIIETVEGHSPWISPIVITFKSDGDIRICVDMRRATKLSYARITHCLLSIQSWPNLDALNYSLV